MPDPEVAALDERVRRVRNAIAIVLVAMVLHFLLVIAILSRLSTPLPWWAGPLFLSLGIGPVLLVVLRVMRASLEGDAAMAQVRAAKRSIDELEAELERVRRERADAGE